MIDLLFTGWIMAWLSAVLVSFGIARVPKRPRTPRCRPVVLSVRWKHLKPT